MIEKNNLYIILIVGIVAITGIIAMNQTHNLQSSSFFTPTTENANTAGNAIKTQNNIKSSSEQQYIFYNVPQENKNGVIKLSEPTVFNAQKGEQIFAIKLPSDEMVAVGSEGYSQNLPNEIYDKTINITLIPVEDVAVYGNYGVLILGYKSNDISLPPAIFEYYSMIPDYPTLVEVPDEDVDMYIFITQTKYTNEMQLSSHYFTKKLMVNSSFEINLNDQKLLKDNFQETAIYNGHINPYQMILGVEYDLAQDFGIGFLTWINYFQPSKINFYSDIDMLSLKPVFVYNDGFKDDLLMLGGDFYDNPTNTNRLREIHINQADLRTVHNTVDSDSLKIPAGYDNYRWIGLCKAPNYLPSGWFWGCPGSGRKENLSHTLTYLRDWWPNYGPAYKDDSNWLFEQLIKYMDPPMPDELIFYEAPISGKITIYNPGGLYYTLEDKNLLYDINYLPNSLKITIDLPNHEIVEGRGRLDIYCSYLQYSNPYIEHCDIGTYHIKIDEQSVINNGEDVYEGYFCYDGNNWAEGQC